MIKENEIINKILSKLEKISNDMHFDSDTHTYFLKKDYRVMTSVSETLSWFRQKLEDIPEETLEKARKRGIEVHKALERHTEHKGEVLLPEEYMTYYLNGVRYLEKQKELGFNVLKVEQIIYSMGDNIGGTMDLLLYKINIEEEDVKVIIKIVDWKTGKLKPSNYAQIGIYQFMLKKALGRIKQVEVITELVCLKP